METFSFSRLSLYETCPYRFYKKYVEGYKEPLTLPLALGKGTHKGIEVKINGANHSEAVLEGYIEAEFHPDINVGELSKLILNAPLHRVNGETEIHFVLPLSDEADSPKIQGFIDLIDENAIYDWKTNRVIYNIRDNFQIALYAWAISKIRGFHKIYGTLFFLRFRRESKFQFTEFEMEEARKWAYGLARQIQGKLALVQAIPDLKDELFPATPSSYCSHCPFAISCFRKFSPVAKIQN